MAWEVIPTTQFPWIAHRKSSVRNFLVVGKSVTLDFSQIGPLSNFTEKN